MYFNTKSKFKKLTILFLSVIMVLSLAFATACSDGSSNKNTNDTDTESTTEETIIDYQTLKNGDFEFETTEKTVYPYSSSSSWSRKYDSDKTQAIPSAGNSGIIDTSKFDDLDEKNKPIDTNAAEKAYINPYTPYYFGLVNNEYDYEDEDNRVNPNTSGSKILMINNTTSIKEGTAQKYTSSSQLKIPADKYGLLTVWVKTVNLSSLSYTSPEDYGAYIQLTDKASSVSYGGVYVNNINTKGEWVKYELYVKGSNLGETSLTLSLGLGKGNETFTQNCVEGYAFFDNLSFKTFNKEDYENIKNDNGAIANKGTTYDTANTEITKINGYLANCTKNPDQKTSYDKTLCESRYSTVPFELNYRVDIATVGTTETLSGTVSYNTHLINSTNPNNDITIGNYISTSPVLYSNLSNEVSTKYAQALSDINKIGNNPSLIYMCFNNASTASFESNDIVIKGKNSADKNANYKYITFFAKIDAKYDSSTKATINVIDTQATSVSNKYKLVYESFETSVKADSENYGEWVKYSIMVNNPTEDDVTFKLLISFGETAKYVQNRYELQQGYAFFADLTISNTTSDNYNFLNNSNNKQVQVYGDKLNFSDSDDSTSSDKDVYQTSVDVNGKFIMPNQPAPYSKSLYFKGDSTKTYDKLNPYYTTGVINSKYVNDTLTYGANNVSINGLDVFKNDLKDSGNTYTQAIVLQNNVKANTSYVSNTFTVPSNTIKRIGIRVRVIGSAEANIYLTTSKLDANNNFLPLSLKTDDFEEMLHAKITSSSLTTNGGWTEVYFYIAAGNEDIEFRLQAYNGNINGEGSIGTIFLEPAIMIDVEDESMFDSDRNAFGLEYAEINSNYAFKTQMHKRPDATVKETVDGSVVESTKTFEETEVFAGNDIVKFVKFTTVHADTVIDNTTTTDTPEEEPEDEEYKISENLALQISSIILSSVLILVLLIIVARNILKKKQRRQQKVASFYDRNTREKAMKKIADKKREINVDLDDDDSEYDYDEAQNIGEEIEETEVVEETIDEEVSNNEEVIDIEELQKTEETEENNPSND